MLQTLLKQLRSYGRRFWERVIAEEAKYPRRKCRCSPDQIARYRGRISGPLLDRIDLQIEVPSLPVDALPRRPGQVAEPSAAVRARHRGLRTPARAAGQA
ncbi:MAG TPA: ATP-binding protein [Casimicrobiaceae bacterium]|nr:ATP-binding protein [Casimicrobiaceae bacterium]